MHLLATTVWENFEICNLKWIEMHLLSWLEKFTLKKKSLKSSGRNLFSNNLSANFWVFFKCFCLALSSKSKSLDDDGMIPSDQILCPFPIWGRKKIMKTCQLLNKNHISGKFDAKIRSLSSVKRQTKHFLTDFIFCNKMIKKLRQIRKILTY